MKRILIKLSGEGLTSKDEKLAIDPKIVNNFVHQIKKILKKGIEVAIVVGGGNFWRGASAEKNGIPRNRADYIGMLATVMNGLALQSAFEQSGVNARIYSSLKVDEKVAANYINEKAMKFLAGKDPVIFVGGIGRPYFTTDTASSLFASEIKADTILMGKNGVDGIYDKDPKVHKNAKRFENIKYDDIISNGLNVMDSTAVSMAKDNEIDLIVFNLKEDNALIRAINNEIKSTKVIK